MSSTSVIIFFSISRFATLLEFELNLWSFASSGKHSILFAKMLNCNMDMKLILTVPEYMTYLFVISGPYHDETIFALEDFIGRDRGMCSPMS